MFRPPAHSPVRFPPRARRRILCSLLGLLLLLPLSLEAGEGLSAVEELSRRPLAPAGLAVWGGRHPGWRGSWDPVRGMPRSLTGPPLVALPPAREILEADPLRRSLLASAAAAFSMRADELAWTGARRIGEWVRVDYEQFIAGRPVLDSWLRAILWRDGRLTALFASGVPEHCRRQDLVWPQAAETEWRAVLDSGTLAGARVLSWRTGWLLPVEGGPGAAPRPVAEVVLSGLFPEREARVRLDLVSGAWLERETLLRFGGAATGTVTGTGVAGWDPDAPPARHLPFPLANLAVEVPGAGTVITGQDGDFSLDLPGAGPVTATAALSGPWTYVLDGAGPELSVSAELLPGAAAVFPFNDPPTGEDTAEIHAFLHVNRAHDWLGGLPVDPPFTGLDTPLQVTVNRLGVGHCNAVFDPNVPELRFLPAGSGCPNTAYASIIYHEYFHAAGFEIFGSNFPADMHEGLADAASVLISGSRQVGRDFYGPGEVLRDVEEDLVHPVAAPFHIRGLVVAGSIWDLRTRLLHELGPEGAQLAAEIWFRSLFFIPSGINVDMVTTLLLADDDDGDLSNGTPHAAAIIDSFAIHGLEHDPVALPPLAGLTDAATAQGVSFTWATGAPYDAIEVERDGSLHTTLPGSSSAWTDEPLSPGVHTYLFRPLAAGLSAPPTPRWVMRGEFRRGDVNGDGLFDLADPIALIDHLFGGTGPLPCADAGDADDSGAVLLGDALHLLEFLFSGGASPPPPFPGPGGDPSPDFLPCAGEL